MNPLSSELDKMPVASTREGRDPIYGGQNRWPIEGHSFRVAMQSYLAACSEFSLMLLEAFCRGLKLPADYLHEEFVDRHTGFIRLNHYPVADPLSGQQIEHQPVADLGVHHHTDAGALTVLLQDDVGGLQVFCNGFWHDVPPVEGALVVNTGDMMQVWSNDVYQAAIHRVLAMDDTDRYSIPFFYNPAAETRVATLPAVVGPDRPRRYRTIQWREFRGQRSEGDYADFGEEIQIAHYRTTSAETA